MLDKQMVIKQANIAKQNDSYLYITLENQQVKFYTNERLSSNEFLDKHKLNYNDLIAGIEPNGFLKYDYIAYNKIDMSAQSFIDAINKQYNI